MLPLVLPAVIAYFAINRWEMIKPYMPSKMVAFFDQLRRSPQMLVMQFQTMVLMFTAAYMIPLDYIGLPIQGYFYSGAIFMALFASFTTVVSNYGVPPVKTEGWEGCKKWLGILSASTEFHWLFYSFMFLSATPFILVLLIPARRAMWTVMKFASKNFAGHPQFLAIKSKWDQIEAQEGHILKMASVGEIVLGFYLVIMLLTPARQILTVFMYYQFLKMRYHTPRTQKTAAEAWNYIGEKTNPYVEKLPPLQKAIDMAKSYFLAPMR